jgi:predicted AAA+ superfamily ATPase
VELTPFLLKEVAQAASWQQLWLRGGFPESLLAAADEDSLDWREDFIRTFLGRDIASLELGLPLPLMERLWRLLAHSQGQPLNTSRLAAPLPAHQQRHRTRPGAGARPAEAGLRDQAVQGAEGVPGLP